MSQGRGPSGLSWESTVDCGRFALARISSRASMKLSSNEGECSRIRKPTVAVVDCVVDRKAKNLWLSSQAWWPGYICKINWRKLTQTVATQSRRGRRLIPEAAAPLFEAVTWVSCSEWCLKCQGHVRDTVSQCVRRAQLMLVLLWSTLSPPASASGSCMTAILSDRPCRVSSDMHISKLW